MKGDEERCPDCGGPLDENDECPGWYEKYQCQICRAESSTLSRVGEIWICDRCREKYLPNQKEGLANGSHTLSQC